MRYLAELVISGLVIGAIYGLIAMAFSVIYKATGIVNFAQGEVGMLIAYLAWSFSTSFGTGSFGVILAAIVAGIALGLLIERLVMRPMLGEPVFSTVLVTIGLAVVLRSLVQLIWGASPHKFGCRCDAARRRCRHPHQPARRDRRADRGAGRRLVLLQAQPLRRGDARGRGRRKDCAPDGRLDRAGAGGRSKRFVGAHLG